MAETIPRPNAQDIRDEQPFNFIKAEDIKKLRFELTLRLPPFLDYLNNLPMCRLSDLDEDSRTCAICREDFETDGYSPNVISLDGQRLEIPVRLSCNHVFGDVCICRWLNWNENCPYCNRILFEKMPSIDTGFGIECHLGFLEICAIHKKLKPEDEERRVFLWGQLERLRAWREHWEELEDYEEPVTEETPGEDTQAHEGSEDTLN